MEDPELAGGYPAGEPRSVTVSADGSRLTFLRSGGADLGDDVRVGVSAGAGAGAGTDQLWVLDVASGTEHLGYDAAADSLTTIESYATDAAAAVAALAVDGALVVADLSGAAPSWVTHRGSGPVTQPRPDPTGTRVAYVCERALRVYDRQTGADALLAAEPDHVTVGWGLPDPAASTQFRRDRGFWWSPDGSAILAARVDSSRVRRWHQADPAQPEQPGRSIRFPSAGTLNPEITMHLLQLDGGWVDVHWDRETYPYLAAVSWSELGGPLLTVLRRAQQHGLVLAVDPRTGETQVHAELADPRWVEPVPGSPCYLPDGRVLIGGELAHDGYDARCLFADGGLLTPASLYVRRVCGRLGPDLLIEASEGEPSEQHLYRVSTRTSTTSVAVQRLTPDAGWHVGHAGADTLVVGARSLEHPGTRWTVFVRGVEAGRLRAQAAPAAAAPRPVLERVTDRALPTGVLYPRSHVAGRRLPVLVDVHGGPGRQEVVAVRAAWQRRQWLADAGFAVVVIDNRGTPGVAPSFEKATHRRLADVVLADQIDALHGLATKHPDLDLTRVAGRGHGFGGWFAVLAALRRPDIYRCALAHAPISDWRLCPTAYAERLLGPPDEANEIYAHHSLLEAAEPARAGDPVAPILIIAELPGDGLAAAQALRLSAALVRAGRPHSLLPVTAATRADLGDAELTRRLRHQELLFLRASLAGERQPGR